MNSAISSIRSGGGDDDTFDSELTIYKNWSELTGEEKHAAVILQWAAHTWDSAAQEDGSRLRFIDRRWEQLTLKEIDACKMLKEPMHMY